LIGMNILNKLLDNNFWYIGTSISELGDNSFCVLVRNPLDDLRGTNDRARSKEYQARKDAHAAEMHRHYQEAFAQAMDDQQSAKPGKSQAKKKNSKPKQD